MIPNLPNNSLSAIIPSVFIGPSLPIWLLWACSAAGDLIRLHRPGQGQEGLPLWQFLPLPLWLSCRIGCSSLHLLWWARFQSHFCGTHGSCFWFGAMLRASPAPTGVPKPGNAEHPVVEQGKSGDGYTLAPLLYNRVISKAQRF